MSENFEGIVVVERVLSQLDAGCIFTGRREDGSTLRVQPDIRLILYVLFVARFLPGCDTYFIEPPWKAVLSNKGLLALLWERFPEHPNLLPTWFADDPRANRLGASYVRKPLYSREGANVRIVERGRIVCDEPGPYGAEGHVLQALCPPPRFAGRHVVVGSWIIGQQACGIGIREDCGPVTKDLSRFVPHVILN